MAPHNSELESDPSGKHALLGLPRWTFYLLIVLGVVIGDAFENLLVSRYSVPKLEAFSLSLARVMLLASLARVVITRVFHREPF
jgi:hypothetical protein